MLKTPEVKFSWIQPIIQDKSPETQEVNYFALFELFSALCVLQENQRMSRNPTEAKGRSGNIKSWRTHYRWGPSWNGSKLAWLENSWFQEITSLSIFMLRFSQEQEFCLTLNWIYEISTRSTPIIHNRRNSANVTWSFYYPTLEWSKH